MRKTDAVIFIFAPCSLATETQRQGKEDKETGRRGNAETRRYEISLSLSPPLLVPSSLFVSVSAVALWQFSTINVQ
jgi:hypothetical protein